MEPPDTNPIHYQQTPGRRTNQITNTIREMALFKLQIITKCDLIIWGQIYSGLCATLIAMPMYKKYELWTRPDKFLQSE